MSKQYRMGDTACTCNVTERTNTRTSNKQHNQCASWDHHGQTNNTKQTQQTMPFAQRQSAVGGEESWSYERYYDNSKSPKQQQFQNKSIRLSHLTSVCLPFQSPRFGECNHTIWIAQGRVGCGKVR